MEWPTDRGLQLRMVATLGLTVALALAAAGTVFLAVRGVVLVVGMAGDAGWLLSAGRPIAAVATVAFLGGLTAAELRLDAGLGLPAVDARAADRESFPVVHGHVDRLAQQVGLPRPTVAVVDADRPLALTTGFRPASATLVVSTGLVDALNDEELGTVVAHELAHVRNRDAAVMTAAALPTVLAAGLRRRADTWIDGDGGFPPLLVVFALAWLLGLVGHLLLSVLSQYRELAADRAAVALTGSPAALATALETIEAADATPSDDLRWDPAVAALSIVDIDDGSEALTLGPEGERDPMFAAPRSTFRRWFDTHPALSRRLDELGSMAAAVEGAGAED